MFCNNCGKELPDGSKFCNYCGASLPEAEPKHIRPEGKPRYVDSRYTENGDTEYDVVNTRIGQPTVDDLEDGTVSARLLNEAMEQSDYDLLPENLRELAREAKETLLTTRDGQLCDIIIDRAALEAIREAGAKTKEKLLEDYGELICATGDIKIAVRCARTGKSRQLIARALAPCSTIDTGSLTDAAAVGFDAICAYLDHTIYSDAVEELKKSLAAFERWCDNRMIRTIKPEIHNPFGIGPLAAYILARDNEIKTVRIILAAKRNDLPEEMLRERVREMYV